MDLRELVNVLLSGDLLIARQYVTDARRENVVWECLAQPPGLNERQLSVAAGVVELLASRAGGPPPTWTRTVGPAHEPVVLDHGLEEMPRSFARAKTAGPEPLRRRTLIALPDFLDVA
jgi:hypothetical protein